MSSGGLDALLQDDSLHTLRGKKRLQHIVTYYKFPLVILCLALFLIGRIIYGHFTHKDILLYTALVNVNTGETLTRQLGDGFLERLGADTREYAVQLYTGLYLTDDELNEWHEYTYASRMKILAAIEGKMMDVVLMNREAFDAFSQNGYLLDLNDFLSVRDPDLQQALQPAMISNIVILQDNRDDMALDASLSYSAVTEEHPFGLELSDAAYIRQAGFEDTVYLGIIANTPREDTVLEYLRYLTLTETRQPSSP
ncbi:MAG: hypothetical protein NC432_01115 [Roseburia sp.]|nr:hypothetical protein [Roseburia sp.]MCM1096672.1 hypothetical protein [Ruminococcus flavefaciens]